MRSPLYLKEVAGLYLKEVAGVEKCRRGIGCLVRI